MLHLIAFHDACKSISTFQNLLIPFKTNNSHHNRKHQQQTSSIHLRRSKTSKVDTLSKKTTYFPNNAIMKL